MLNSDDAFKMIDKISELSGISKIYYMKEHGEGLKPYLLAAYNPYVRYYASRSHKGRGEFQFDKLTWVLLEKLSTRELSGNFAKETINSITTGMTRMSAELFLRILSKDLRMGMGPKSINKAFPGLIPIHDVMLAKLFDPKRLVFPCFGSTKIDGVRAKLKDGKFYSRGGHEYIGLEHLTCEFEGFTEELDGELIVPNKTFQESSGLIRNDKATPGAEFRIFELPTLKVPFVERLSSITDIDQATGPKVKPVIHTLLNNKDEVMEHYDICRRFGFEGSVIKPYDYEYVDSRSYRWMKMKPVDTIDLRVVDVYEGKGKYKGMLGGVEVVFYGKPNKVGGGWSDHQRKIFWENPELILNKVIEIWFMEKTDDGNMRHSRVINVREDKS